MMKVLLLNGSPHAAGCTFTALSEVAGELNKQGIETEMIQVGHLNLRGCVACGGCSKTGQCVMNDIVNEISEKLRDSDGLVVGSPVYYAGANSTLTSALTRLFYSHNYDLSMKVGAAVVSCRRGGASATFDELNKFFTISGMPIASSQYWNSVHGNNAEQVRQDLEGMQVMRTLGRNMAFLIKSIQLGKEQFGLPEKEPHVWTNFVR